MKGFGYYKEKLSNHQIPIFANLDLDLDKGIVFIKNIRPSTLAAILKFGDLMEFVFTDKDNKSKDIVLEIVTETAPGIYQGKILKLSENKRRFPRFNVRNLDVRVIVAGTYFGFLRDISLRGFSVEIKEVPDKLFLKKTYPVKILYKGKEYKFSSQLVGMSYDDEKECYILRFRILESLRNIKLIDELYKKLFEDELKLFLSS